MEALISLKGATGLKFSKNELNYPSAFANNDYSLFSLGISVTKKTHTCK